MRESTIKVSRKSIHYRLAKLWNEYELEYMKLDSCRYINLVFCGFFKLLFLVIFTLIFGSFGVALLVCVPMFSVYVMWKYGVAMDYKALLGNDLGAFAEVGRVIIAVYFCLGSGWWYDINRYEVNDFFRKLRLKKMIKPEKSKEENPKKPSAVRELYKSWKEKYCVKIKFIND